MNGQGSFRAGLRNRFQSRMADYLPVLTAWVEAGSNSTDPEARLRIHNLAGGAALFGFESVSHAARQVDKAATAGFIGQDLTHALLLALHDALQE